MPATSTVVAPNANRSTNDLLLRYIAAIGEVANDPAISVKSFFVLYGKLFWWELNLFVLPIIVIINIFIFFWNRFAKQRKSYVLGVSIRYTVAAIKSFHDGEIPLLKFLTLRFVTDMFVVYHIRRRAERISLGLQNQELVRLLSGDNAQEADSLKQDSEIVEKFRANLATRMKVTGGILLLLVPYIPIVFKLIDIQKSKDIFVRAYEWLSSPTVLSGKTILVLSTSVLYGMWVFVSSFIRKREIMRRNDIYPLEQKLFAKLAVPSICEFPLDLVLWGLFYLVLTLPLAIQLRLRLQMMNIAQGPTSEGAPLWQILPGLVLWSLPFIYAFYRRLRARNL